LSSSTDRQAVWGLCVLFAAAGAGRAAEQVVWLDELDLGKTTCGWQKTLARRSVGGNPLRLRGKTFERGVGTHPPGQMSIDLGGQAKRFTAVVGIDDESNGGGSSEFKVVADGKQVWTSGVLRGRDPARQVDLDLTGVRQLELIVTVGGDGYGSDHTDWADAKLVVAGRRPRITTPPPPPPPSAFDIALRDLNRLKSDRGRIEQQVFHPAALAYDTDRDPVDVDLRRTGALLDHIRGMDGAPDLSALAAELAKLKAEADAGNVGDRKAREALFERVRVLRSRIAFANPLLNFDRILFLKKHFLPGQEGQGNHMCDQYFGFHALREGGLFVLEDPFSDHPTVRSLLEDTVCEDGRFKGQKLHGRGGFLAPGLSYDAKSILFAWTEAEPTRYQWSEQSTYHVFRVNADGTGLRQLTDGPWNDFDPEWLPSGRIVFISERRGGFGRCHGRPVPSFTLHTMGADGTDIRCLSPHETNEWHPSVDSDGMIVYTRWDYVDRGFNQAHHPWTTSPDGRDARAVHGNFARHQGGRPHMEMDCRAIPPRPVGGEEAGTGGRRTVRKYVATACGHHGQAYGSLIVIDPGVEEDDAMSTTRRLTPEVRFPESDGGRRRYATAWPLSEYFYLCVYDPEGEASRGTSNRYALCLLDAFGNKIVLHRDPEISCLSPMPLRPRPRPPILAETARPQRPPGMSKLLDTSDPGPESTGVVGLVNVYDGHLPWPEGTRITSLRVVQLLPKTTPRADSPKIGYGSQKGARGVLGTVPVEPDGSAYFELPTGVPVYFQALDANGLAVQSMRSATYVHASQTLMCAGCHDNRWRPPAVGKVPSAMRRPPSRIEPEVEGSRPFGFPRLVQPVLNARCVPCHRKEPKAPDLSAGEPGKGPRGWYPSYETLRKVAFYFDNAVWTDPRTVPGKFGARASKLYQMLSAGHHDVKLSAEELRRITLWLDCNSDFYGAYEHTKEQALGEVIQPSLE